MEETTGASGDEALSDTDHVLSTDVLAFSRSALPPPPARVLEVGAGDGELAAALRTAGYEVTAIDPASEPGNGVERRALIDARGSFDAALAILSLHHVEPLEPSCAHLATLLPEGGRLVIDEFDVMRLDERAAAWWLSQRRALGHHREESTPAELVAGLVEHVHSLAAMRAALLPYFAFGEAVPGPYLHRWDLEPGLREVEVHLVATGQLPAIGARLIATRRPS